MRIFNYILLGFAILCLVFYVSSRSKPYQIITGKTMGTYYNIKIRTDKEDNLLNSEIKTLLDDIVFSQSVFDENSELSKINKSNSGDWISLSPNMSDVMKKSYEAYRLSGGYFDPTVGKLVDLWGFGASKATKIPTDEEIKDVLEYTGFNKVKFSDDFTRIKKTNPNIYINLSAIAKGYGVDRVAELIKSKGYENFIVEIGGEVKAFGDNASESYGWNIGVMKPLRNKAETAFVVKIKDSSTATSGDYRNYRDVNGSNLSHTIDPKTGKPVKNNVSSVTVFDDDCARADALATAITAMGYKKGIKFANENKLKVIIFIRNIDDTFETIVSEKAKKILSIGEQ